MAKIAKISLTADITGLKKKTDEGKKILSSLGQVKIPEDTKRKIEQAIFGGLDKKAATLTKEIEASEKALTKFARASGTAFDSSKIAKQLKEITSARKELERIDALRKRGGEGGGEGGSPEGGGGGGAFGRFMRGRGMGALGRMAAATGLTVGVGALVQRRMEMAEDRIRIRQLGGGDINETDSKLGFTAEERRERGFEIQQAVGRRTTGDELTKMVDLGETMERAYGISGGQQAESMSVARKAGVQDQTKFLSDSVGTAVAAGLEGSRIGEYLEAMTGTLQEMSQGINIDTESLNGFAGALSSIPFFKSDPARTAQAMRGLNQAFTSGDRFQQSLATRAILGATGGGPGGMPSPGATEFRRSMGLFAEPISKEEGEKMRGEGIDESYIRMRSTPPEKMLSEFFKQVMGSTQGLQGDFGQQAFQFQQATGMQAGASEELLRKLRTAEQEGKPLEGVIAQKDKEAFKRGQMAPQERLESVMGGVEGEMKMLNENIHNLNDTMARAFGLPAAKAVNTGVGVTGVEAAGALGAGGIATALGASVAGATGAAAVGVPLAGAALGYGATKAADWATGGGYSNVVGKPGEWLAGAMEPPLQQTLNKGSTPALSSAFSQMTTPSSGMPSNVVQGPWGGQGQVVSTPASSTDNSANVDKNTRALTDLTSILQEKARNQEIQDRRPSDPRSTMRTGN